MDSASLVVCLWNLTHVDTVLALVSSFSIPSSIADTGQPHGDQTAGQSHARRVQTRPVTAVNCAVEARHTSGNVLKRLWTDARESE